MEGVMLATFLFVMFLIMIVRNGGGSMAFMLNLITVMGFGLQLLTTSWSEIYKLFKHAHFHSLLFNIIC